MDIVVTDAVADVVADRLVEQARAGGHVALTGGSTPGAAYEKAAASGADWTRAVLWFGDDRAVPPDDPRSNYLLARRTLIDRIPPELAPRVERIEGELGPDEAADRYERRLVGELGGPIPLLDLVLLGLGSDGHVASIFPGKPAFEVRDRAVVGVPEAGLEPFVPRVTMTLPVFNAAREAMFMVTGENKADAVAGAFGGEPRPDIPASYVRPPKLTVVLDPAAASKLPPTT